VNASIGLSVFRDDAAATGSALIAADHAMYDAKTGGGGRVAYRAPSGPPAQRARPRA
jgi:GGDEF domain-containing protein